MYAESSHKHANAFNCVQRAHQNLLENYHVFLMLLALSCIEHPIAGAACGAVRLAGMVAYALGYQTGDPKKRMNGAFGYLGLFGMLGMSIKTAVTLIMA